MSTQPAHAHHNEQNDCGCDSRRNFLKRFGMVAGAGVATPWAVQLASMAPAAAAQAGDDYRALVCVFLYGGNDNWNSFVPNDSEGYATYAAARPGLARGRGEILPLSPVGGFTGAGSIGFAPELERLHARFNAGDAALVANVGTLLQPLTKQSYEVVANRPPQLFSHNDQQSFWQSGAPEGATSGWGGRISDQLLDGNGASSLFTSISAAGNAIMMSGEQALQYQVSQRGVTTLRTDVLGADSLNVGLRAVMNQRRGGLFPAAYADTTRRALAAADDLSFAIDEASQGNPVDQFFAFENSPGPATNLGRQLEVVANLILAGRDVLGLKRQVFFVGLGGFDNHSRLLADHRPLMESLDLGLSGFADAMNAIGAHDTVTTFTASDFGRSLLSNGDGTDHGWGAHHLVIGGGVRGNRVVGPLPVVADDGPDDVGQGRLLPTQSVDQYAASLGQWLGVPEAGLASVAPRLKQFESSDLGLFVT